MKRTMQAALAGGAALALGVSGTASAATDDGAPRVVNRETVSAELSTTGSLDVARLISQISVTGRGTVDVADPVSGKNLRNLDGFAAPSVRDGKAIYRIDVNGTTSRRTVSDYTKPLPVSIRAEYTFDGKRVDPGDVVGRTGELSVRYTVKNLTGAPTTITWKDGKGVQQTRTTDVVTPFVGQLQTDLPATFSHLDAPRADVAGDGRGGNLLAYTMVLFEPIGSIEQSFGWTAHVREARVPKVDLQLLPVPPSRKPELKFGQDGFQEGASQATDLTEGAGQIDANLLKLRNGASDLLAGLTKLAAGATALRDGLTDKLAPGASQLAAGAGTAQSGSAQLASGLGDLSGGAAQLSSGLADAKDGSAALATGLGAARTGATDLADGIAQILAGVRALPTTLASDPDYQKLLGALTGVQAAITTRLLPGLQALQTGVGSVKAGLQSVLSGVSAGSTSVTALITTLTQDVVAAGGDATVLGDISTLAGALTTQTSQLVGALGQIITGLGATSDLTPATIQGGLNLVGLGLSNPACDLADPTNASNPCGIKQVQGLVAAGIGQLVQTISAELTAVLTKASAGAADLADGVGQLADGASALDDGMAQLADGGAQVADGASQAAAGGTSLAGGLNKLATGAGQLSSGLTSAANGGQQLASGLDQAKAGDQQVVDGAGRLRTEGTQKLVSSGNDTASQNAERYALMVALNDKAKDGALPYGAPEGATGTAVYSLTLAAATQDAQDNTTRGVTTVLVLALALGLSALLRRRVAAR